MNSFKKIFQKSNDDQKVSLKHSKTMHYHGTTRTNIETRADLLSKFPHSPEPTEGLPRSGFRALSLKATVNHTSGDVLRTPQNHTRSGRLAERIRAKSSTDRSHVAPPPAPAPPLPTTRAPHHIVSRFAHSSSVNIREVPSHVVVLTPAPTNQSYSPYSQYDPILREQDPTVLRELINRYPLAPVGRENSPEHMRSMHFDMDERRSPEKTLQWYIHMALAQRRSLYVRAGGRYRHIVDASNMGIVPETGSDWSQQGDR